MQFIYLGEARFYKERMSEFLTVSMNLEIKELSNAIKMKDQNTSDRVESNDNNVADENMDIARDETHHPPLLARMGSTGLVKKANVVGENELVNEYLLCKLCREYIIFHDKTQ